MDSQAWLVMQPSKYPMELLQIAAIACFPKSDARKNRKF
jgi:hypothetical protein